MFKVFLVLFLFCSTSWAQYEDYESYQTFTDIDKWQRDFGLIFAPSLFYVNIDEDNSVDNGTVSDRARSLLLYDLNFGYIFRGGFYFGLLYSGETVDINKNSPKTQRESVGLSFGYIKWGWSLRASFLPYSKQTLATDGTIDVEKYAEGMGFQLDFAYFFRVGRYASIGPQLVYKSIQYREATSATTNVTTDASSNHSVITPMISIMFNLYRG